jgi:hypothetical protein
MAFVGSSGFATAGLRADTFAFAFGFVFSWWLGFDFAGMGSLFFTKATQCKNPAFASDVKLPKSSTIYRFDDNFLFA